MYSVSTYKCVHESKKRVFQKTSSIPRVFQTFESSKPLFCLSEASPTSKEFCNKEGAFHSQKELLLSRLYRETEQLQEEQTLSHRGNSSS